VQKRAGKKKIFIETSRRGGRLGKFEQNTIDMPRNNFSTTIMIENLIGKAK